MTNEDRMTVDVEFEADTYELRNTIVEKAATKISKHAEDKVSRDVVQEALDQVMEELQPDLKALLEGPIQKTNNYGEPISGHRNGTRTFREEVVKQAKDYLKQKVKKRDGSTNTSYNCDTCTRAQYLIRTATQEIVQEELKTRIDEVVEQVKDEITSEADEMLRDAVREIVGLKE